MAAQDSSSDVLRDYIIVKFLADRPKISPPISSLKTDDGLLNNLKALFKEADLPEPMYMNSAANLYNRINHIVNDNKGHLKAKVKTSFAAMQSVLQLCGFNATTGEDVHRAAEVEARQDVGPRRRFRVVGKSYQDGVSKFVHSLGGARPAAGCSRGATEAARFEGGSIHQCCHRHSEEQR
jgi:hypothetical protein